MSAGGPDVGVILAGGGGTRLWPWTGPSRPKPLLPLGGGGRTLLRATLDRLRGAVPDGKVRVLAAAHLLGTLSAAEPSLPAASLWDEPSPRDTAAAVALAMRRVQREDPDAVVAILPADHRVADEARFRAALHAAAETARAGRLCVLGIAPTAPSTRFGYIVPAAGASGGAALPVERFVEKPAEEAARGLLARGAMWNAGIFVWRADTFWRALEAHAPAIASAVAATVDGEAGAWERTPRTSIDYALMEHVRDVAVVPLDAGWDDVGGWDAVAALVLGGDAGPVACLPVGGESTAQTLVLDLTEAPSPRAIVLGDRPLLVVLGPEGVLVAPRDAADRVKSHV